MNLYIGTYTRDGSRGIYRATLGEPGGRLGRPELAAELANPTFLAPHPQRAVLYAASEVASHEGQRSGAVLALAIEHDGRLALINQLPTGGEGTCYVSVHPSGQVLLAANYGGGSVATFTLNEDGSLRKRAAFVQHEGSGPNPKRQNKPHAHSFLADPTGRFALAADLGTDDVRIYRLGSGGELTHHAAVKLAPGAGPRHIAFHPDAYSAYVINELDNTVTAFAWDGHAGRLTPRQTVPALPEDFAGASYTAEVRVHPSGRFLYASNRGHDSIAIFAVDSETGRLTARGHVVTGGSNPRHFNLDPGGRWLVAANQTSGTLVAFAVDSQTGSLTPTGSSVELALPVCVCFIPRPA